jgi:hypothetical protein
MSKKDWGRAYKDLRIRVDVNTLGAQRHEIVLFFQNIGKQQLKVWQSGFYQNTMVQCYDSKGASAEPTAQGQEWLRYFCPGGERSYNRQVALNPGQTYESRPVVELEKLYKLNPTQEYNVSVAYEEYLVDGWFGAITSNIVKVR